MSKIEHAATLAARLSYEAATHAAQGMVPPHVAARDALAMIRIGQGAARRAVQLCNGFPRYDAKARQMLNTWTEADDARREKADAKALERASTIAERYGATVKLGGDPRGYVMRLYLASGASNTFGDDGWGVA
jgi:hypothetical protein